MSTVMSGHEAAPQDNSAAARKNVYDLIERMLGRYITNDERKQLKKRLRAYGNVVSENWRKQYEQICAAKKRRETRRDTRTITSHPRAAGKKTAMEKWRSRKQAPKSFLKDF